MGLFTHWRSQKWIVRHFQDQLSRKQEKAMRRHLAECMECRAIYAAQMLAEGRNSMESDLRHQRFERALFGPAITTQETTTKDNIQTQHSGAPWQYFLRWTALAASTAAVFIVFVVWPYLFPTIREKGGSSNSANQYVSISIFGRSPAGQFRPIPKSVINGQPLAFAYLNQSPRQFDRLMIFGVDEQYEVYWFYPAWTDSRTNPTAYPIRPGPKAVELPEQVTHSFSGKWLRIWGVFTRKRDLSVKHIELAILDLKKRGIDIETLEHFPLKDSGQHSILLKVKQP